MDLYCNYFDENIKSNEENKTIGLILVKENNEIVVKYSSVIRNQSIYISKYLDYKLEQMKAATETTTHSIVIKVVKDDNDWDVSQLSSEDLQKIHGIYEYEELTDEKFFTLVDDLYKKYGINLQCYISSTDNIK